jgi:hypothetical protein
MSVWILLVVGAWLVTMGTMGVVGGLVKDTDRAQTEVFAAARRERFVAPSRRVPVATPRRATRVHAPRSYVSG